MACCRNTPYFFTNQSSTVIAYDAVLQQIYGIYPKVQVWYRDAVTGKYTQSTFFTPVTVDGGNITVDHGGPNSGFITIT